MGAIGGGRADDVPEEGASLPMAGGVGAAADPREVGRGPPRGRRRGGLRCNVGAPCRTEVSDHRGIPSIVLDKFARLCRHAVHAQHPGSTTATCRGWFQPFVPRSRTPIIHQVRTVKDVAARQPIHLGLGPGCCVAAPDFACAAHATWRVRSSRVGPHRNCGSHSVSGIPAFSRIPRLQYVLVWSRGMPMGAGFVQNCARRPSPWEGVGPHSLRKGLRGSPRMAGPSARGRGRSEPGRGHSPVAEPAWWRMVQALGTPSADARHGSPIGTGAEMTPSPARSGPTPPKTEEKGAPPSSVGARKGGGRGASTGGAGGQGHGCFPAFLLHTRRHSRRGAEMSGAQR